MKTLSPTPYPDANEILHLLQTAVQRILGEQLLGMYLHGSLSNGGFDEHSDIDIVFVTKNEVSEDMFSALHAMHLEMAKLDSPWAHQLEVSYIPQHSLRRFDRSDMLHPHLDRGRGEVLHRMAHESDWVIQRFVLRERGVIITGPHPITLIDPISPDDLRRAIVEVLPLWLGPILEQPSQISKRGYQSFFVLSLCRIFYTLKYGEIVSKAAAANWALEALDAKWKELIERALAGRQNPNLDAQPVDVNETLDMMRYAIQQAKPTLYPEVNEVLNLLLVNGKEILGDQFVGMYLYGSLSSGDFNLDTSDIDFLVVTTKALSEKTISALETMHKQIWASDLKWAGKLEGAYVPRQLIRRHHPEGGACPTVNEGKFYVAPLGSDWIIQRHVVREHSVVVNGPDPKTLIDFVSPEDIRGAVRGILQEWWFPMLDEPSWLRDRQPGYRAFAVITMCRVLHALESGTILSKPQAVQWARTRLPNSWKQLIDRAAAVSLHNNLDVPLSETLDFIRFTREQVLLNS